MNDSLLIRYGGVAWLGVAVGAAGMFWWQTVAWEEELNRTDSKRWHNGGEAYLIDDEASHTNDGILESDLHLHDTYHVVADGRIFTGLAGMALVSIFLISCSGQGDQARENHNT